jgi:hypothetical protein
MASSDPSLDVLLTAARHHEPEESWLDEILQQELALLSASMPEWHSSSCLLHDLGNCMTRTTVLLSRLADKVVNGQELLLYARGRVREMEDETGFSELDPLVYMAEKHSSLKHDDTCSIADRRG